MQNAPTPKLRFPEDFAHPTSANPAERKAQDSVGSRVKRWQRSLQSGLIASATLPMLILGAIATAPAAIAQTPAPQITPDREVTPDREATPSAEAAPAELTNLLSQIDAAANQRNAPGVMRFFSRNLIHSDGLTYSNMQQALTGFWRRFNRLNYSTQVNSWEREGNALIAETTTTITGTQTVNGRTFNLTATVDSRQRFENGQIVRQDILNENSRLTAGQNPPALTVMLPREVAAGREFNFDAIVQEPLNRRLLLGSAIEEPVRAAGFAESPALDLELLSAGGLFKVGRAPLAPGGRWVSAVIIREDGMTIETRRLQVTGRSNAPEQRPPLRRPPQQNQRPNSQPNRRQPPAPRP